MSENNVISSMKRLAAAAHSSAQPDLSLAVLDRREVKQDTPEQVVHTQPAPQLPTDPPFLHTDVESIYGAACGGACRANRAGAAARSDDGPLGVAVPDMYGLPSSGHHPYLGRKPAQGQGQGQGQQQGQQGGLEYDEDSASMK